MNCFKTEFWVLCPPLAWRLGSTHEIHRLFLVGCPTKFQSYGSKAHGYCRFKQVCPWGPNPLVGVGLTP